MSEKVIEANDSNFQQEVLQSEKPVIVDFWSPSCGPCLQFAPTFDKLAEEYWDKARFVKVNVAENMETPSKFGIAAVPTFIFFKDGEQLWDSIIWANTEEIKSRLDSL